MSAYSKRERKLATYLENFSRIKALIKFFYQRLVFIFNLPRKEIEIADDYVLEDLFPELEGETFFGYYDKPSINIKGGMLTHCVSKGICSIYYKTSNGVLTKVADTNAWNWQQGAMLTWLNSKQIAYNDISEGMAICCIYSIDLKRIIKRNQYPIQCYSASKGLYASIDYHKLNLLRPEYGYKRLTVKNFGKDEAIKVCQIYSGSVQFQLYLNEIIKFLEIKDLPKNVKVNHCQFSPDGNLILFIFRVFRHNGSHRFLLSWDYKSGSLQKIFSRRLVSHYSWISNKEIIAWGKGTEGTGYHIADIYGNSKYLKLKNLLLLGDGHPSFSVKDQTILTDTYPNKSRMSSLFLIEEKNEKQLLRVKQPWKFNGSNRVDLHPRYSADKKLITIDSGHNGLRRQYVVKKKKICSQY